VAHAVPWPCATASETADIGSQPVFPAVHVKETVAAPMVVEDRGSSTETAAVTAGPPVPVSSGVDAAAAVGVATVATC
jgi:hypothetical protein